MRPLANTFGGASGIGGLNSYDQVNLVEQSLCLLEIRIGQNGSHCLGQGHEGPCGLLRKVPSISERPHISLGRDLDRISMV